VFAAEARGALAREQARRAAALRAEVGWGRLGGGEHTEMLCFALLNPASAQPVTPF